VQRDRGQVGMPRPAEVGGHDGEAGVRGSHRVEPQRVRVVDPDALAAGLACADAAGSSVEQRDKPEPLAFGDSDRRRASRDLGRTRVGFP